MEESGCSRPVSVRRMRTDSLPFSQVPSQSKLFLDHLADPISLRKYYPNAVASHMETAGMAEPVLLNYETDREALCNALGRINEAFGAGPETMGHIELLRRSGTVAVLTGQQAGLFTGPLYSIYKALSAVRLAECLRGRGIDAVPVFWMATEDHDLEEVSNAFAIGDSGELIESRFEAAPDDDQLSVGNVNLNGSVDEAIKALFESLPRTEFLDEVRKQVEECWHSGVGFGQAFGTYLTKLLGKHGLIIVDPLDRDIKQLASPMYVRAIEQSREIVESLVERGIELSKDGYEPQVLVEKDYFPLFWHDEDGRRTALRWTADGTLRPKGRKETFTIDQLADLARSEPSRFSPGVMLRPAVQDYLFPTVCYFGGGAEVAYFAQNSEVYRILERPVTPILHRQSFTVIEPRHARTLDEYGLSFQDLFAGEAAVLPGVIDKYIDPDSARLFADVEERINTELNRLDQALSVLDVTLAENLATRRRKIIYHIGALRKKYYLRRAETDETINRRVKGAFTSLLPGDHLQERTLNVTSFLARYGTNFIDMIYDSIDLDDKGHRVVYL